jgi:hypothetical protein
MGMLSVYCIKFSSNLGSDIPEMILVVLSFVFMVKAGYWMSSADICYAIKFVHGESCALDVIG